MKLELLLTKLLNPKASASHQVDSDFSAVYFADEKNDKQPITISLKGLFSSQNLAELKMTTETLDDYKKTFSTEIGKNHEFQHLAYAYAANHYSVHGTRINKMIREESYLFTLKEPRQLASSTIEDIKAAIVLSHGLFQHIPQKTYETFRLTEWPQDFFPFGCWPSISYYVQEPAFLSFSRKSGAMNFNYDPHRIYIYIYSAKNFGMNISPISGYRFEKEVVLPPGTEVSYKVINKLANIIFLEATFVNSRADQKETKLLQSIPQIKRPSDFIQDYFITYIFDNFYSKPFKDINDCKIDTELKFGHMIVYKPNHGMIHAIRKMERVIFCILFFAEHSNNKDLAEFCRQLIEQDEIIVLGDKIKSQQLIDEIALLTGATSIGRESEYSFSDNPKKYQEYRRQSIERFLQFLESAKSKFGFEISEQRLKIYMEVLTHFGEPDYMNKMKEFHLCIMHLINTPQILDMRRCYATKLSMNILKERLESVIHPESKKYLRPLMQFGVQWLKLTGDRIIDKDKCVLSQSYKYTFLFYSTIGILQCKKLLRQAPGIFFSNCVSLQPTTKEELTYKMVEHLSTTMILKNNRKELDNRKQVSTELASLIREMARLPITIYLRIQLLEVLIKKKVNSLTKQQKAEALITATKERSISPETVKQLLEVKISPNFQNENGETALMAAVSAANHECKQKTKIDLTQQFPLNKVQLLLEYKADPYLCSKKNMSALDYAEKTTSQAAYFLLSKFSPLYQKFNLSHSEPTGSSIHMTLID